MSDWTTFNQLVFASAVYVFFTNLLPGITFASDLDALTGATWSTIEVVLSTGICGIIFSLYVFKLVSVYYNIRCSCDYKRSQQGSLFICLVLNLSYVYRIN